MRSISMKQEYDGQSYTPGIAVLWHYYPGVDVEDCCFDLRPFLSLATVRNQVIQQYQDAQITSERGRFYIEKGKVCFQARSFILW